VGIREDVGGTRNSHADIPRVRFGRCTGVVANLGIKEARNLLRSTPGIALHGARARDHHECEHSSSPDGVVSVRNELTCMKAAAMLTYI
jgi:hypothetical protein